MKPLDGFFVAFVAHETASRSRAETLEGAGATVRLASPELDLWTALGEGTFDALVVLVSAGEPSPFAILAALDADARTRAIPVLVLVDPSSFADVLRSAKSKRMVVLSSEASDDALVRAVVELGSTDRVLRDLENQHRAQLHSMMARADDSRAELHNVAHDLRALLGIAFGFACNLRDEVVGPLNAEQRDHVMRILEASRDATGLLDRTKESARMPRALPTASIRSESVRPARVQRTLIDLAALAESVKTLFEPTAHSQSKTFSCRTEPIAVWGDGLKLKQVLVNLVGNAIKYSPPGGAIRVAVRWGQPTEVGGTAGRKRAEIVVTNTGSDIAPESRRRIFERGFRLDEHAHLPGQGVGLSIVQGVVAQHSGTVHVESRPGEGATFVVSLPTDLRVRDRGLGVLMVPESEAATVLIDAIRSARPDELTAMMADRPREFLDMVAACGAFVVVPRDKASPLSEALAEILTPFSPRSEDP
jgi:signal transduction histidine kinase